MFNMNRYARLDVKPGTWVQYVNIQYEIDVQDQAQNLEPRTLKFNMLMFNMKWMCPTRPGFCVPGSALPDNDINLE